MPDGTPYSERIARIYDLMVEGERESYAQGHELAFILNAFQNATGGRGVERVLDVGCGTGRHVVPLAREGYRVTGIDSSPHMLAECRRRLEEKGLRATLHRQDMLDLEAQGEFDAVLSMNSALCYLVRTEDVRRALGLFRRALRPGGMLVLDMWNFLHQWERLGETCADVREADGIRIDYCDYHWLEDFNARYHIEIEATVQEGGETYEIGVHEVVRLMTGGEVAAYLREAGFAEVRVFPDFDPTSWGETSGERLVFRACRPAH